MGDLVIGYTTEGNTVVLVIISSFLVTVPKAQYVKRDLTTTWTAHERLVELERVGYFESPPFDDGAKAPKAEVTPAFAPKPLGTRGEGFFEPQSIDPPGHAYLAETAVQVAEQGATKE